MNENSYYLNLKTGNVCTIDEIFKYLCEYYELDEEYLESNEIHTLDDLFDDLDLSFSAIDFAPIDEKNTKKY